MKEKRKTSKVKREFGTETCTTPLSIIHDKPTSTKIVFSRIAIVLTIGFWVLYVISTIIRQFFEGASTFQFTMEAFGYLIIVTVLTFSALLYLIERQGAFQRFNKHVRVPRAKLDDYFSRNQPTITVLIPSYSEEPQVVRKTIMSAALQEYPQVRVVLLIDDNPNSTNPDIVTKLNTTREITKDITKLFSEPSIRFNKALSSFLKKYKKGKTVGNQDIKDLIENYNWAINWLRMIADNEEIEDHVDKFFADQVLRGLANELKLVKDVLLASYNEGATLPYQRVNQLYSRLVWIFDTKLETFERKKFASLSHEANKAMNLNAYIGLMGGIYRPKDTPQGVILTPVSKQSKGDIVFPDSDFLLTLDADSILLREYCLRLVYFLEQPDNSKVAVTQTPYSSFRGSRTRIERLAGATTDIQHILHQGMSYYDGTFWVGANAIIRKIALEDIVEKEYVGGFEIKRYIQDRTVIEDTESSIDLSLHGWSLVNYPERLSYSATPPDFGSLIVQRRRWADGGLLILPKLYSQIQERKRQGSRVSTMEIMLRINYMSSIAWSSIGLIFLLVFPYDSKLLSPLILLAALPYFLAMASDLKYCGYKRSDVFRIYGFNLVLLPVNLAGVFKSIQQAFSGNKIPFARTPKVKNRTIAPMFYIIAPIFIVIFSLFTLWRDEIAQNWGNAAFAAFNVFLTSWAIIAYIGIRNSIIDIYYGFKNWLYIDVEKKHKNISENPEPEFDWRSTLYHGDINATIISQNNKNELI